MMVFQICLVVIGSLVYAAFGNVVRIGGSDCCSYSEAVAEFVVSCADEAGYTEVDDTINSLPDVSNIVRRDAWIGVNPAIRYILTLTDPSFGSCESLNTVVNILKDFPYVSTIEEFSCAGCPYPSWPCPEAPLLDMSVAAAYIPALTTTSSPIVPTPSCLNEKSTDLP